MTALEALLARLRSGRVKQIKYRLADPDGGRCCLGVACDIGVEYGAVKLPVALGRSYLTYEGSTGLLPERVKNLFGFDSIGGAYIDAKGEHQSLHNDNDNRDLTFSQIADIIESRPKGLFVDPQPSSNSPAL